jgi:hypothetical protein
MVANAGCRRVGDTSAGTAPSGPVGATNPFMKVTAVQPSKLLVEAVLIK